MFDIHRSPLTDERDDTMAEGEYVEVLMTAFAESPEGQQCATEWERTGWAEIFLEYGMSYRGEIPPEMTTHSIDEVVFELFPRKVSAEPESAAGMIGELRYFWRFLQREYRLANAAEILQALEPPAEEKLKAELGDSANFGMAKSMVMMGHEAGFDMTSQEGMQEFMIAYNASLVANRPQAKEDATRRIDSPAASPSRSKPTITTGHLTRQQRRSRERELRRRMNRGK